MRYLLVALLLWSAAPLCAEEFTTDAAKAAKAAYEAELKTAREHYITALEEAAKKAVEDGNLNEVVRIKEAKDVLEGKKPSPDKATKTERVLWKQSKGYFERLNDGFWIERVGDGSANIFAQSTKNDEYIELSRQGVLVRLYDDKATALFRGKADFGPLYRGKWTSR